MLLIAFAALVPTLGPAQAAEPAPSCVEAQAEARFCGVGGWNEVVFVRNTSEAPATCIVWTDTVSTQTLVTVAPGEDAVVVVYLCAAAAFFNAYVTCTCGSAQGASP